MSQVGRVAARFRRFRRRRKRNLSADARKDLVLCFSAWALGFVGFAPVGFRVFLRLKPGTPVLGFWYTPTRFLGYLILYIEGG